MVKCEGSTHRVACSDIAEFVVTPQMFLGVDADPFRLCEEHMLRTLRNGVVRQSKVEKIRV